MRNIKKHFMVLFLTFSIAFFITACEEKPPVKKQVKPSVVKKTIPQKPKTSAQKKNDGSNSKLNASEKNDNKKTPSPNMDAKIPDGSSKSMTTIDAVKEQAKSSLAVLSQEGKDKTEHYKSQGKIDPFKPLIQEKSDDAPAVKEERPKRILTPLEKIALSQIKLVAVIEMKDRNIAMVEEASGKGYEVSVGTYIGKKSGRITEIKSDRIVIKELVRDFKGRLKEQMQEIKLNKNDDGE